MATRRVSCGRLHNRRAHNSYGCFCRPATLSRRKQVSEQWLLESISKLDEEGRRRAEALGLKDEAAKMAAADVRDLRSRGRLGGPLSTEEMSGRQSGSLAWRQARAEV